jgi:hypothetical protein
MMDVFITSHCICRVYHQYQMLNVLLEAVPECLCPSFDYHLAIYIFSEGQDPRGVDVTNKMRDHEEEWLDHCFVSFRKVT